MVPFSVPFRTLTSRRLFASLGLLLVCLIAVCGCALPGLPGLSGQSGAHTTSGPSTTVGHSGTAGSTTPLAVATDRTWTLVRFTRNGQDYPLVASAPVTLLLRSHPASDHRTVAGISACNAYGGTYIATEQGLRIDINMATLKFCASPVGDLETAYLSALQQATSYRLANGELVLTSATGTTLTFAAE